MTDSLAPPGAFAQLSSVSVLLLFNGREFVGFRLRVVGNNEGKVR